MTRKFLDSYYSTLHMYYNVYLHYDNLFISRAAFFSRFILAANEYNLVSETLSYFQRTARGLQCDKATNNFYVYYY